MSCEIEEACSDLVSATHGIQPDTAAEVHQLSVAGHESSSVATLMQKLVALAKENADLRLKLSIPLEDRFLQECVTEEIKAFVASSVDEIRRQNIVEMPHDVTHAIVALEQTAAKNVEFEKTISHLEDAVIAPLRAENEKLSIKFQELQNENELLRSSESIQNKILAQRLEDSLSREAQLRSEVGTLERTTKQLTAQAESMLTALSATVNGREEQRELELVSAKSSIYQLKTKLEQHNETCRLLRLESVQDRTSERETREATDSVIQNATTELRQINSQLVARIQQLTLDVDDLRSQLERRNQEDKISQLPDFQDLKRRRLEIDNRLGLSDEATLKRELITFWYDGHAKIEDLESELRGMRNLRSTLSEAQATNASLTRDRSKVISALRELSCEVDRLREENVSLRSQNIGLQAENKALIENVILLSGKGEATDSDSNACRDVCARLRDEAEKFAQLNSRAVADPVEVENALRQIQTLKHDISQLRKTKELLEQSISTREAQLKCFDRVIQQDFGTAPSRPNDLVVTVSKSSTACEEEAVVLRSSIPIFEEDVSTLREAVLEAEFRCDLAKKQRAEAVEFSLNCLKLASAAANVAAEQVAVVSEVHHQRAEVLKILQRMEDTEITSKSSSLSTDSLGKVHQALSEQISLLNSAVEREQRQHAVKETEYIAALLSELRAKESALCASRQAFDDYLTSHSKQLASEALKISTARDTKVSEALKASLEKQRRLEASLADEKFLAQLASRSWGSAKTSVPPPAFQPNIVEDEESVGNTMRITTIVDGILGSTN